MQGAEGVNREDGLQSRGKKEGPAQAGRRRWRGWSEGALRGFALSTGDVL